MADVLFFEVIELVWKIDTKNIPFWFGFSYYEKAFVELRILKKLFFYLINIPIENYFNLYVLTWNIPNYVFVLKQVICMYINISNLVSPN